VSVGGGVTRPSRLLSSLWLAALALGASGCQSCQPPWAGSLELRDGFRYAAASAGEVFVDADATDLALTRAARRLADALGLDVERRLAVTLRDGQLSVEAWGPDGPLQDLDGLELVELRRCGADLHARVRLELR